MKQTRVLNYIAFVALVASLFLGWQWPWGLLFIYWAVPAWMAGEAHLLGPVSRKQDPFLFWAIITLWGLLGLLLVLADVAPEFTKTYLL